MGSGLQSSIIPMSYKEENAQFKKELEELLKGP
jgi:hypothetical protein